MAKAKPQHPTLTTSRLRLRQFRMDDADAMHACLADAEATRFWNRPAHVRRVETERAVARFIDCSPSYYRFWAIADLATDRALGLVNYHDGDIRNRRATIGYILDPAYHRQGLGSEAVSAMLDHCFGELGLRRLQAFIVPENTASVALAEKLGFRREGLLRENLSDGDAWRDEALYALLAHERPKEKAASA